MTTAVKYRTKANLIASTIAVFAVFFAVVGFVALFLKGRDLWTATGALSLFTIPFSVAAWHGRYKESSGERKTPITFRGWRNLLIGSAVLSAIFVAIDVAVVHPGLSVSITGGAVVSALAALGGTIRAWIRRRLMARERQEKFDA